MFSNRMLRRLIVRGSDLFHRRFGKSRTGPQEAPEPGRRELLGAALAANGLIWFASESSAASPGNAAPLAATERLDIRDFGAKGDRRADDIESIRKAIARAQQTDQYPLSVFVPAGNFRRSDSIALPSHLCLVGEGISSILNSQNDSAFKKPILVNQDRAGLISARVQDLALFGGSHGIRLDAEQENADLRLQNVSMLMQSVANIEANKLLQTVKISNCIFGSAPWGIRVAGTGTNCFYADGSEWIDHAEGSIFLRGADGVTIVGGRFEGGGAVGRYCIDIENGSNLLFLGCFFENVHEFLARFRHIEGPVVFQSCHFSGTNLGGGALRAFRWDTGDTKVLFRDCVSLQPMLVGGHVMLEGSNHGIVAKEVLVQGSAQSGRLLAQPRTLRADQPALVLEASAEPSWRLHAQLTLLPDAGQIGGPISVTLTADSNSRDMVLAANPYAIRLVHMEPRRWGIFIASVDARRTAHLGYTFAWDFTAAATPPTVRVPLT